MGYETRNKLYLVVWKTTKANHAQLHLYPNPTKMAAELITPTDSRFKKSVEIIVRVTTI